MLAARLLPPVAVAPVPLSTTMLQGLPASRGCSASQATKRMNPSNAPGVAAPSGTTAKRLSGLSPDRGDAWLPSCCCCCCCCCCCGCCCSSR
jgi:hypothetical protein